MLDENNDNSSSSDDEISKDALAEATDHQFLKDSYFFSAKSKTSDISKATNKHSDQIENNSTTNVVSLRKNLEQADKFSNFGVSPSYQNYVAKKLDEIIEKSIREKRTKAHNNTSEKRNENIAIGVKLLNSSAEFLAVKEEVDVSPKKRKRKVEAIIEDKTNLLKCKEVAVDPEWILSKKETKTWTSKRKEPEFKYQKQKNGTLIEASRY